MTTKPATPAQLDALRQMAEHGPLRFVKGGSWSWEGCPVQATRDGSVWVVSPVWSTTIGTLRACEARGWVRCAIDLPRAGDQRPEVCRTWYEPTRAGRAVVAAADEPTEAEIDREIADDREAAEAVQDDEDAGRAIVDGAA